MKKLSLKDLERLYDMATCPEVLKRLAEADELLRRAFDEIAFSGKQDKQIYKDIQQYLSDDLELVIEVDEEGLIQ